MVTPPPILHASTPAPPTKKSPLLYPEEQSAIKAPGTELKVCNRTMLFKRRLDCLERKGGTHSQAR